MVLCNGLKAFYWLLMRIYWCHTIGWPKLMHKLMPVPWLPAFLLYQVAQGVIDLASCLMMLLREASNAAQQAQNARQTQDDAEASRRKVNNTCATGMEESRSPWNTRITQLGRKIGCMPRRSIQHLPVGGAIWVFGWFGRGQEVEWIKLMQGMYIHYWLLTCFVFYT